MFLKNTIRRNPELIDTVFELHQNNELTPDSFVVDMDQLLENAKMILDQANENQIELYFMLKQLGRNPVIAKKLMDLGYAGAVVVDFKEAKVMMRHRIPIRNVGHLVQVPKGMMQEIIAYGSEFITVYSLEKIAEINTGAKQCGKVQKIMLRVSDDSDMMYSGQMAGFDLSELEAVIKACQKYQNIKIAGVTSFPCFLYQEESKKITQTNNLQTVMRAADILKQHGITAEVINTPSSTCTEMISLMKESGSNCGEPGHGLTGTTPAHEQYDLCEKPCVVYLSEISHNFAGKAYCYGGGFYRRSHVSNALVGNNREQGEMVKVYPPSLESIDYHFELSKEQSVGETVIMAFRFQIFVTRSDVVLVEGIKTGQPRIIGIYDSLGNEVQR